MSSALREREVGFLDLADNTRMVGQEVTVLQTKREKSISGSLGQLVCEVSTIDGMVTSLPHEDATGKFVNTVHIDREGQPTYVFPKDPVTVVEHCGAAVLHRELHFDIIPGDYTPQIS